MKICPYQVDFPLFNGLYLDKPGVIAHVGSTSHFYRYTAYVWSIGTKYAEKIVDRGGPL